MKSGPKKKTAQQLALVETTFAKVTSARPPAKLAPAERREWRKLVHLLKPTGLLTTADEWALVLLARAQVRCDECEAIIAREGMVIEAHGQSVPHPLTKVRAAAAREVERLLPRFAMIPSARARERDARPVLDFSGPDPFAHYGPDAGDEPDAAPVDAETRSRITRALLD